MGYHVGEKFAAAEAMSHLTYGGTPAAYTERFLTWLLDRSQYPTVGSQTRRESKRLRRTAKTRSLSAKEKEMLRRLETKSVYSTDSKRLIEKVRAGETAVGISLDLEKQPGRKGPGNLEEAKRLYVGWRIDPERTRESQRHCQPPAVEMRVRRFEQRWIETGKLSCKQVVEEQFSRFKSARVHAEHPELWQNFPPGKIPRQNILKLARLMRFTAADSQLIERLCQAGPRKRAGGPPGRSPDSVRRGR